MNIQQSVLGLTKNNNGYFKSEKQSVFLRKMIEEEGGLIGSFSAWGHSKSIEVTKMDAEGIIEIITHSSTTNKEEVYFQRKVEGQLTVIEEKKLKKMKRKLKSDIKYYEKSLESWENGTYSKKNPDYKNDPLTVELFNERRSIESERIENLKNKILEIEK